MRVLHLYSGNLFGGVEKLLLTLASERSACVEMEPHFALCFEGRLAAELRATGVPTHILGAVRLSRPWTVWLARRALKQLLTTSPRFDVVITHSCWLHAIFAPMVRRCGAPLVFWSHDAYRRITWIDRAAARTKPELVIANSQYTLTTIPALFSEVPGEVLYYPVTPPPPMDRDAVRMQVRVDLGCSPQTTVIFMGARLETWKGHTLLLEALALLKPGDWQAWIAGGSQRRHEELYYAELKAMAQRLGINERVRWLGQRKDMPSLLAAADIHCQPNTGPEPFGIVFIEAMQAGLPVVTTRLGAAPEIVDETCGILTVPADRQSLAAALNQIMITAHRACFTGGQHRAKTLCDPAQQLRRLQSTIAAVLPNR